MALIFDVAAKTISTLDAKVFITFVVIPLALYFIYSNKYTDHTNVPTVGIPPGLFGRLRAPYRWRTESQVLVNEGMLKYGNFHKPFKIGCPQRWIVFITNPTILNEMKSMPLDILSFRKQSEEFSQTKYTSHKGIMEDAWHMVPIMGGITERLAKILPDVVNEVATVLEGLDIASGDGWTEVKLFPVVVNLIARATSRVLVGLPLCRDEEYLNNVIDYSKSLIEAISWLEMTPRILQGLVARLLIGKNKTFLTILKQVGPTFEERRQQINVGDENTPNDVFKWILQAAPPDAPIHKLLGSLLLLNVASIHTSTVTLMHLLFDLAANPSYQAPLRDEIFDKLSGGWTKQALTEMKKTDSVLRESARVNGISVGTLMRKVVTSHTFSDGTHVTKGCWIGAPTISIHHSDKIYESPDIFDGFRFYRMRQAEGMANKFQNVTTSVDYLAFGLGSNPCPGRFFATNELKVILAHVLLKFEIKLKDGMARPENVYAGIACLPDISVSLLFRRRDDGRILKG